VYKEEDCVTLFLARTIPVLKQIGSYEIIFCLDPSPDRTEQIIRAEAEGNPDIKLIRLSRRFGQPSATMAGILNATGRSIVVIDADLQDPPELIPDLYRKLCEGVDVVFAKRRSRLGTTWSRKLVSILGYRLIASIADVDIPRNTGDFRIMSRRVVEDLRHLPEGHGFLRGLVAFVGYQQAALEFDRADRAAGRSKYNRITGPFRIAFNGVFGFSTVPLSVLLWLGLLICAASFALIVGVVVKKLIIGEAYPLGIPTIMVLVLFLGGMQLAALGVIGEYIGRIYNDVRRRPLYNIDEAVNLVPRAQFGPIAHD